VTAGRACLHHLDLATRPSPSVLDRITRPCVARSDGLEEIEDVLRARSSPKSEQVVIRIDQSPAAADRHEPGVPDLRQDHRGIHSADPFGRQRAADVYAPRTTSKSPVGQPA
jgi:hypothetical protein